MQWLFPIFAALPWLAAIAWFIRGSLGGDAPSLAETARERLWSR